MAEKTEAAGPTRDEKRRAFLKRAGKASAGVAATTGVLATMRPKKAAAQYEK
jgi:hypothetical protein